jgi:hypothetical protein
MIKKFIIPGTLLTASLLGIYVYNKLKKLNKKIKELKRKKQLIESRLSLQEKNIDQS